MKARAIPSVWPTSEILGWVGLSIVGLRNLESEGVFTKVGRGQYQARETIRAVIEHYRTKMKGTGAQMNEDRAREQKANADRAELAFEIESGKFIPVESAREVWDSAIVELREAINKDKRITKESRLALVEIASSLKLHEPEAKN